MSYNSVDLLCWQLLTDFQKLPGQRGRKSPCLPVSSSSLHCCLWSTLYCMSKLTCPLHSILNAIMLLNCDAVLVESYVFMRKCFLLWCYVWWWLLMLATYFCGQSMLWLHRFFRLSIENCCSFIRFVHVFLFPAWHRYMQRCLLSSRKSFTSELRSQ